MFFQQSPVAAPAAAPEAVSVAGVDDDTRGRICARGQDTAAADLVGQPFRVTAVESPIVAAAPLLATAAGSPRCGRWWESPAAMVTGLSPS